MAGTSSAPYDSDLTFRTEVRPQLYLASVGLLVIGFVFTAYFLTTPEAGIAGILAATVGVFMLYIAWVNFWATRAGYPHLVLRGHRLTVLSSAGRSGSSAVPRCITRAMSGPPGRRRWRWSRASASISSTWSGGSRGCTRWVRARMSIPPVRARRDHRRGHFGRS